MMGAVVGAGGWCSTLFASELLCELDLGIAEDRPAPIGDKIFGLSFLLSSGQNELFFPFNKCWSSSTDAFLLRISTNGVPGGLGAGLPGMNCFSIGGPARGGLTGELVWRDGVNGRDASGDSAESASNSSEPALRMGVVAEAVCIPDLSGGLNMVDERLAGTLICLNFLNALSFAFSLESW